MSEIDAVAGIALRQHGCITIRQLHGLGWSDHRVGRLVRDGVLVRTSRGVFRLVGAAATFRSEVAAAVLASGPQALAAHRTAAALHRLGPSRDGVVEVVSPRGARLTGGRILRHETLDLPGRDRAVIDGIPVTSPTRTLIDMGRHVGATRLGSLMDDAVRRRLTSYPAIHERFAELARRGRPGVATLRSVLLDRPGGAPPPGSDFETLTRRVLVDAGLPPPVLQHPVQCEEYRFLLDLAWPEHLVAVECEGFLYHSTPDQLRWDEFRRNGLLLLGWLVLSYSWQRVREEPTAVAAEVGRALRARGGG